MIAIADMERQRPACRFTTVTSGPEERRRKGDAALGLSPLMQQLHVCSGRDSGEPSPIDALQLIDVLKQNRRRPR